MNCTENIRQDLKFSTIDAVFWSLMVGAGETFFAAFALANGCSDVTAGLVAVVPFLAGSVLQLVSLSVLKRLGSYRLWVSGCAIGQGLTFIVLGYFAFQQHIGTPLLYFLVSLYWGFGMGAGPAWNSWITSLVPCGLRTRYIAKRNHLSQKALLLCLIVSGFYLDWAERHHQEFQAFAWLFIIAGAARLISSYSLLRHSEGRLTVNEQTRITPSDLLKRVRYYHDGRFLLFMILFQVCVTISGPYSSPYMLTQLHLGYLGYMGLIATSYIAKVFIYGLIGDFGKRRGTLSLIKLGVLGAAFSPVIWIFSDDYVYLVFCQIFGGAIWAMYDFGCQLRIFEMIPARERTSFLSYFNLTNAVAVVCGSLVGAELLKLFGEVKTTYLILFCLSGALRLTLFFQLKYFFKQQPQSVPAFYQRVKAKVARFKRPA